MSGKVGKNWVDKVAERARAGAVLDRVEHIALMKHMGAEFEGDGLFGEIENDVDTIVRLACDNYMKLREAGEVLPLHAVRFLVENGRIEDPNPEGIPKTGAERTAEYANRYSDIASRIPPVKDPERREKCRKSLLLFGTTYCMKAHEKAPGFFLREPQGKMLELIEQLEYGILHNSYLLGEWPRGWGKTTWMYCGYIWALCYGHRRFIVHLGATEKKAQNGLRGIQKYLEMSNAFCEDFPEIAVAFRALERRAQRCPVQKYKGELTRILISPTALVFPTIGDSDFNGGRIICCGRGGAIRGESEMGERPDFIGLDDIQTLEMADSAQQIEDTEDWINGDVLGLGGHDVKISAYMAATTIRENDLVERYEANPAWRLVKVPLIISDPWSKRMDLVDEYLEIRAQDEALRVPNFTNATSFYVEHQAEIEEGVELICDNVYFANEVSAFQHALNLIFDMGMRKFLSECQLSPVKSTTALSLRPEDVYTKLSGVPEMVMPDWAHSAVATIDCMQEEGLRWVITAVGRAQRASVIGYGQYPKGGKLFESTLPIPEQTAQFKAHVSNLVNILYDMPIRRTANGAELVKLRAIGIDRGWQAHAVVAACRESPHADILFPTLGRDSTQAMPKGAHGLNKKNIIGIGDHCYLAHGTGSGEGFIFLLVNVDYWKEFTQRSFLGAPGLPGATCLYGSRREDHVAFASEIVAERLVDKGTNASGIEFWNWDKKKKDANHFLDGTSNSLALATWLNLFDSAPLVSQAASGLAAPKKKTTFAVTIPR